ncbi:MAG: SEC-C metal-binding domain-containing protein, partial [Pseudomonadota bacterium]
NVQSSLSCIASLVSRALDGESMSKDIDEDVRRNADTLIADCLEAMNAARLAMHLSPASAALHVGRNDPCPCGSGKKFKKCCLN